MGAPSQQPNGVARGKQSDLSSMFKNGKASASSSAGKSKEATQNGHADEEMKNGADDRQPVASSSAGPARKRSRIQISDDEDDSPPVTAPQKEAATTSTKKPPKADDAGRSAAHSSSNKGRKVEQGSNQKDGNTVINARKSPSASPGEEECGVSSAGEEDKEDRKAHAKMAAIFMKPSERKAAEAASAASSSSSTAKWPAGKPIPYSALAETFSQIDSTTKRLEIQSILSNFLANVISHAQKPEEVTQVVYLCINRLCPDYIGMELGLGEGLLVKALAQTFGRSIDKIKKELERLGDLGLVAIESRNKQPTMFKTSPLTVPNTFNTLREIAQISGNKSQERKLGLIKKLLAACQGDETKWIVRSLEGKLRIGLAERTVIVGLAHSAVLSKLGKGKDKMSPDELSAKLESATAKVKTAYSEMPNYDRLVPALLNVGPERLSEECRLTPGIPLKPMLAKPTKAITEVLDRFEGKPFTCEYKYDGERAQVHFYVPGEADAITGEQAAPTTDVAAPASEGRAASSKGKLGVFSRNSEDMSPKYPDLLESIPRFVKPETKSFVLDAEVTAWKKAVVDADGNVTDAGGLQPFQQLSTRKRKDIQLDKITVKVKLFAFDLLYLNGQSLLHEDLATRRAKLREAFRPVQDEFDFATSQDCDTIEEIQTFLDASVKDRCEGLMVKMLEGQDAFYEPSRRSMNWLKVKKDYLSGTGDSLDLVVIGGYYGKGKRTNVYGAFLLGCYDVDTESYQSVCKIGTGFSEANLEDFTAQLKPLALESKRGYHDIGEAKPDVFFEPKIVWEVLTADLSLSPVYTAAKGVVESRGISLRFPRFIRIRDDKDAEDSTSPEQIAEMYRAQASASKGGGGGGGADDDFW